MRRPKTNLPQTLLYGDSHGGFANDSYGMQPRTNPDRATIAPVRLDPRLCQQFVDEFGEVRGVIVTAQMEARIVIMIIS